MANTNAQNAINNTAQLERPHRSILQQPNNPNIFASTTNEPPIAVDEKNPIFSSKIDWSKYNWPICFNLVHFSLDEVSPKVRYVFILLYANFFVYILLFILKTFVQFFVRSKLWLSIFTGILSFILIFFQFLTFYSAYRGFFYEDTYKLLYKILAVIFIIFATLNAIIDGFIFDGILLILKYMDENERENVRVLLFLLFLEFFVTCIFLILSVLTFILFLYYERKYDN